MMRARRVLLFGTFDMLHPGHRYLLATARRYADHVIVLVAHDQTVLRLKGRAPAQSQAERIRAIRGAGLADELLAGSPCGSPYDALEAARPDVILLGYDQTHFTAQLGSQLAARGITCHIVRGRACEPDTYKTSLLRNPDTSQRTHA